MYTVYSNEKQKTLFKKAVSFLIVLCMMISAILPLTAVTASAAAPTSYTTITTNSTASVSITSSGSAQYFKFVPTASGTYKFYSTNYTSDPYGALLDASGNTLTTNDDGGTDYNFSITYDCTANTTYYIKAYLYSSSSTGSYTLNVQTVSIDCECSYTLQSTTTADCENDGVETYVCSLCGNSYTNTVATALGHNYVNGTCTRCGDVDYSTLTVVNITTAGGMNYPLFNSGRTGSGHRYSSTSNPDDTSYTNNGYDLYANMSGSNEIIQLGLPFVIGVSINEQATVNIYAYDVDEYDTHHGHSGDERDYIYLVNETTGARTKLDGYLSGQNETWNNTSLTISSELLDVGNTYHFELDVDCTCGCGTFWVVYVRTVNLIINGSTEPPVVPTTGIENADLSASISSSGLVSVDLTANAYTSETYTLEYKAVCAADNAQYGGKAYSVTIPTTSTEFDTTFQLESGAPRGTYEITVFIKDAAGTVIATRTATASYGYSAVSYNSNGGSQNLPTDGTTYSSGDTVTVKFDYVPSMYGYTFLGWSTDRNATEPMYTENGAKTFTIGASDVTLYAVWELDVCTHEWTETSRTDATCTTVGRINYACSCGETRSELIEPTNHNYQITDTVEPTCTTDGYIAFACQNTGCEATKRQTLERLGHNYAGDNICDRCGHTIEIHTHDYEINIVEPTCTAMGYTEYTCSCGYSYRDNYLEPIRHDWNDGQITIIATCTTDGLMTYTCEICGATKTTIIAAEHQWSEVVTVGKTCTTDGSMTKTCTVCGEIVTEIIPAEHNWDTGVVTLEPTCETEGSKICACEVCGDTQVLDIPALGHTYVNGVCTRCGEKFIDNITPSTHPVYGMYFEIDDILSDYGPSLIDEYGLMLDYNSDANLEKVAVYLTQDGTMWRRCIAVKGTNITYATYVPYLSYQSDIKYTGLNHDWINIFRLSENSAGIWCYNNYATIGVNLEDAYGNLLLSLYDIGQAGAQTRIFDDLDEMIAWLTDECINHTPGEWIVDVPASCVSGSQHKECTACGKTIESEAIPPVADHISSEWIVDVAPTATQTGSRHKECTVCGAVLETEIMPILAKLVIENVEAKAGKTVRVTIDIQNNPGIIGALLTIEYDPALTLIDAEAGSAWNTLNFTSPNTFSNPCNFVWDGVSGADFSNGSIIVLTFEIPVGVDVGTIYNISAYYTYGNMINENLEAVDLEIENGSITIVNTVGDVNDDGVVDIADVIVLRRYLAGDHEVVIDEFAADMDNDGYITVADVVLLRRFLVG